MEVKNCKECGRMFNYIGGQRVCPECREALEAKFRQVKEYINEHASATIQQISEDNEVSIPQIHQWIREERLIFTEDSVVGIECENCGKTIRTGRFCDECKNKMAHDLGDMYRKPEEHMQRNKDARERARMRFLDN